MKSFVKICGLRTNEDIQAVNAIKPDLAGFIVNYPSSTRNVSTEQLATLTQQLDKSIASVGVFVNEPVESVAALLNADVICTAQLHGNEDLAYIKKLKTLTNKPLIQAFKVTTPNDVLLAQQSLADYILLDSGKGSGITLDWNLLQHTKQPFILAGGLSPENVAQAIKQTHPLGVDASSGLETNHKKDVQKMQHYVENARMAFAAYS